MDQFANSSTQSDQTDLVNPKDQKTQDEEEASASSTSGTGEQEEDQPKQENSSETGGDSADEESQDGSPVGDYSPSTEQKDAFGNDRLDEPGEFGEDGLEHLQDLIGAGEDDLPHSLGDILADALQVTSRQSLDHAVTVAIPTPKNASPLTEADVLEARQASMALRTRLQGLLQTKILARASNGRRGRLDTGQLHRLAVSDPRLFRVKAERTGIDTAVHILLDCSGSMVRRIRLACCSCYAVSSALEASKINVAVTAFPSSQLQNGSYSTVAPVITHGQKVHASLDLVPAGGTPMGEALWWVMQDMLPLSEKRKLILIVTDGEPDSLECATQAIEQGEKAGFEIYGIGITSPGINVLLPGRSAVVNSMTDLAPAMFTLLEGAILGR
jgi:nitric oxide reductase activation protein